MSTPDRVLKYLESHAGTERTIAEALNATTTEVFAALSELLETDRVELYQSQSGDEMYRHSAKVYADLRRKRPNQATTWGVPLALETVWTSPVSEGVADEPENEIPVPTEPVEEAAPDLKPVVTAPKPAKQKAKPKRSTPFTPLSWEEKELTDHEYNENYYQSL